MKKITSVAFAFYAFGALAQLPVSTAPQNKKVVLEEFTGIYCQYCPDGHKIAANMRAADPNNVFLMNIHTGGFATVANGEQDLKTVEGDAIRLIPNMNVTGYPMGAINRKVLVGTAMAASRGSWNNMANTIKSQAAYCNVALQATINPQTRLITVDVEVYYTANGTASTNSLSLFMLENYVKGKQIDSGPYYPENFNADGTYNHMHVLRKALSPTFGVTIPNTTQGTKFTQTFTYTIPATYGATGKTTVCNLENVEVLAFVSATNVDIINANMGPVYFTNDAKAVSTTLSGFNCGNTISPVINVKNNGLAAITALTITPAVDNVAGSNIMWTGNLAPGASTNITLANVSSPVGGGHALTYTISGVSPADFLVTNNSQAKMDFYSATGYAGTPVAEGFVLGKFPPVGWALINADKGKTWSRSTATGGYNMTFNSTKYDFFSNTAIGDIDELYLPPADLSGNSDPELYFDYAYAQRTGNENDKLEVMISDDCGASWKTVWGKAGSNLATAPASLYSYLPNPNDIMEWTTVQLTLTNVNKSTIVAKFVTTNDHGNNLYLDNVNLVQKAPVGVAKQSSNQSWSSIYPNPANESINLSINSVSQSALTMTIHNAIGQVVLTKPIAVNMGQNNIAVDVKELPTGVYNVTLEGAGMASSKKLSVIK